MNSDQPIPIICIDQSTLNGAKIFDPNNWSRQESKKIIYSALSEYSVLEYCVKQLVSICKTPQTFINQHINTIKTQWAKSRFDLEKTIIYGQYPNLHLHIEAFFLE